MGDDPPTEQFSRPKPQSVSSLLNVRWGFAILSRLLRPCERLDVWLKKRTLKKTTGKGAKISDRGNKTSSTKFPGYIGIP